MLRDRRLAHLQAHRDVANSPLLKRQIIQNFPPAGSATALKESEVVAALAISSGAVDAAAPEPAKQLRRGLLDEVRRFFRGESMPTCRGLPCPPSDDG